MGNDHVYILTTAQKMIEGSRTLYHVCTADALCHKTITQSHSCGVSILSLLAILDAGGAEFEILSPRLHVGMQKYGPPPSIPVGHRRVYSFLSCQV